MLSPLVFVHLALITIPFSVAVVHFYDKIGFPPQLQESWDEPIMVNTYSFKSTDVNQNLDPTPSKNFFGLWWGRNSKIPAKPRIESMTAPYDSFYKNTQPFPIFSSCSNNGIIELASKVLNLVDTLDEQPIDQAKWLQKYSILVQDCQNLAQNSFLKPQDLNDRERLWAIGIWVALVKGKKDNLDFRSQIPEGLTTQVYLEIQAAWRESYQKLLL